MPPIIFLIGGFIVYLQYLKNRDSKNLSKSFLLKEL